MDKGVDVALRGPERDIYRNVTFLINLNGAGTAGGGPDKLIGNRTQRALKRALASFYFLLLPLVTGI